MTKPRLTLHTPVDADPAIVAELRAVATSLGADLVESADAPACTYGVTLHVPETPAEPAAPEAQS
jgi:hypothetical protein